MLKGVRMGYLRTKTADFVLTMAKGPFTLFSPSPLKLFISYDSSNDRSSGTTSCMPGGLLHRHIPLSSRLQRLV